MSRKIKKIIIQFDDGFDVYFETDDCSFKITNNVMVDRSSFYPFERYKPGGMQKLDLEATKGCKLNQFADFIEVT